MPDLYVVVEGYGEQGFIRECLALYLAKQGINVYAPLVGKPGHKGGVRPWPAVRKDITRFLGMNRPDRPVYVSMMFDYFRLPRDWPGRQDASTMPHSKKAPHVEALIAADIAASMGEGFWPDRFIPYIQMHELEALVLAEPQNLRAEFIGQDTAVDALINSIAGIPPEEINDNPATALSKRIIEHLPEYERRKAQAAVNVLCLTGIEVLRNRCPHFAEWLGRLEALGGLAAGY